MPCDCLYYPTKCCHTKYSEPTLPDECRCGRGATNGIVPVLISQLFLLFGLLFAAATVGDCNLVSLDEPIMVRQDKTMASSLGMLSYRNADSGLCYYWFADADVDDNANDILDSGAIDSIMVDIYDEGRGGGNQTTSATAIGAIDTQSQFNYYLMDVLGNDWFVPIGLCAAALVLSVFIFFYSTSFYCSTQVNGCRCFLGSVVGLCLPILQGLAMNFVYTSNLCDEEGCNIGRSTYFSIAAAVSFLFSGIGYWTMINWPGHTALRNLDIDRSYESGEPKKPKAKPRQSSRHSRSSFTGIPKPGSRSGSFNAGGSNNSFGIPQGRRNSRPGSNRSGRSRVDTDDTGNGSSGMNDKLSGRTEREVDIESGNSDDSGGGGSHGDLSDSVGSNTSPRVARVPLDEPFPTTMKSVPTPRKSKTPMKSTWQPRKPQHSPVSSPVPSKKGKVKALAKKIESDADPKEDSDSILSDDSNSICIDEKQPIRGKYATGMRHEASGLVADGGSSHHVDDPDLVTTPNSRRSKIGQGSSHGRQSSTFLDESVGVELAASTQALSKSSTHIGAVNEEDYD